VRLIVCMVDGQQVTVEDFDPDTVLDLLDAVRTDDLLTFALDGGVTTHVRTAAVTRIDIE
jgi:formate-dependent phosphoribosylglycinamide formyltransferase (GAR transformylase)